MKLIVAGSRSFENSLIAYQFLEKELSKLNISEIVSGTARGIDKFGEYYAEKHNIPVKKFPANWKYYGKGAGYIRNREMSYYADAAFILWDGKSRGTKHMIDLAKKNCNEVYLYVIEKN